MSSGALKGRVGSAMREEKTSLSDILALCGMLALVLALSAAVAVQDRLNASKELFRHE